MNCYDASSGQLYWSLQGLYSNDVPSPAADRNLLFIAGGDNPLRPRKEASLKTNCCLDLTLKDGIPAYQILWQDTKALAYHASPVIHRGLVYIITRNGILHCRDALTGENRYVVRLENTSWATPIASGELIYFFGKDGFTSVIRAGDNFERIASNRLWADEAYRVRKEAAQVDPENKVSLPPASPEVTKQMEAVLDEAVGDVVYGVAAIDGAFYVRTGNVLFCIGHPNK